MHLPQKKSGLHAASLLLLGIAFQGLISILSAQESYQAAYDRLKSKIESETPLPHPSEGALEPYLIWMKTKAEDRDYAMKLSSKAKAEGNPYWENRFTELANMASQSGESTKLDAMFKFMRSEGRRPVPEGYQQACMAAGPEFGEKIYNTAAENGFITEDIRERARCLMRYASNDLEGRWLYTSHDSFLGKYDSDGFQVLPSGDWSVTCLRRGEFTTTNQGDPLPGAERGMLMCKEVRDICEFYNLTPEYNDMTDLMVQFLTEKMVLCLRPPSEGHQWYMKLAEEYKLDKATEHMEGFYATIKGKVEKEEDGIRKPVAGAEVEFEAPKNFKTWKTTTDQSGYYRIEGVLLHKSCGPFILIARGDGCYKMEDIPGPLEEPDKSYELEKNILLECGIKGYSGSITVTKSWDITKRYDDYSITETGTQTVTFHGTFRPKKEMEGLEGQPIKMFEPASVSGTWRHNEDRYCEGSGGCGKCQGLVYQEYGTGTIPAETIEGLLLIINVWPSEIKEVASQLQQFGFENWYDIATPGESVPTQTRSKNETESGCEWSNSTSTAILTGSDLRYKVVDINFLKGKVSWSSSKGSTGISVTNMPEAGGDQKPFDPEKNGAGYTYIIIWDLKAINPGK